MKTRQSRREILKLGGVGLTVPLIPNLQAKSQGASSNAQKGPVEFSLGLASYSLREFNLDQTLSMAKRVGLESICLKSMHLPMDSTPEQIQAISAKVREAGLDLYGAGVVYMKEKAHRAVAPGRRVGIARRP